MFKHLEVFFRHAQGRAVSIIFTSLGFLFGAWVTQIPYVKTKFALNDAELGLLLLSMPLGTVVFTPFIARIIQRFGMRAVTIYGGIQMAIVYALPVNMPYLWLTAVALSMVGMCITLTNIAMNACVMQIEANDRVYIMSSCHGMFSLGGMVGAGLSSFANGLGVDSRWQMIAATLVVVLLTAWVSNQILRIDVPQQPLETAKSAFQWPKGTLLVLVCISICTNFTEGAMADWTAVYMKEVVKANTFFVGWGFATYALLMAFGRFMGDWLVPRFGRTNILKYSGGIVALGIATAVVFPYTFTGILGFGLVGIGVSCGAPILYSSAMQLSGSGHGEGLATMNTFSIVGFLIGPALIGFFSNILGLPTALCFIGILGTLWSFLSQKYKI